MYVHEYELTTFSKSTLQNEYCEICNKILNIGDIVRPFPIGGGFMFWCEICDKKEEPKGE
jgi:hypothetical protein|tara:strand:- start:525 stop:704 length:180 start_codon:yes stop_codon:yes gene_type:complete